MAIVSTQKAVRTFSIWQNGQLSGQRELLKFLGHLYAKVKVVEAKTKWKERQLKIDNHTHLRGLNHDALLL
jgi:hypothetical protein